MGSPNAPVLTQLARQIAHFSDAATRLADLSSIASRTGWESLERDLGTAIRAVLGASVSRLERRANALRAALAAAETRREIVDVQRALILFRRDYLAVETVVEFFGDAVNTRTSTTIGWQLRALDAIAEASLTSVLKPLGKKTPPVLTYLQKGLGASILKTGLTLWDGRSRSPVAAIKVVRHNLVRPTALLHEAGHELAHQLGFVPELAAALEARLAGVNREVAILWRGWASEVAADAFAFGNAGYAAIAALHDVLAGEPSRVTDVPMLDPHPASWIRVLLGVAMCQRFFGAGPWDAMGQAWRALYPIEERSDPHAALLRASDAALPLLVAIILETPYRAFGGRTFSECLDPTRVRPEALFALERSAGPALHTSSVWVERECVRLLALSGYRMATELSRSAELLEEQRTWMRKLGELALAA